MTTTLWHTDAERAGAIHFIRILHTPLLSSIRSITLKYCRESLLFTLRDAPYENPEERGGRGKRIFRGKSRRTIRIFTTSLCTDTNSVVLCVSGLTFCVCCTMCMESPARHSFLLQPLRRALCVRPLWCVFTYVLCCAVLCCAVWVSARGRTHII